MNLRAPSQSQQILFAIAFACCPTGAVFAQAPAPASHFLKLRGGQALPGTILGVAGGGVQFQTQAGTVTYPLANVEAVQMPQPPEIALARQAFDNKDYPKALALAKSVADKFKGLPVEWAQYATQLVGDLYVTTNDLPKAEAAYNEFESLYKSAGGLQAAVGRARIAAAKSDFVKARGLVQTITEQALKEKNVPRANAIAYSGAFFVMGQVREADKDFSGALEDYLRTVTIFWNDAAAVAAAQERADALRKDNKNKKTTEQLAVP